MDSGVLFFFPLYFSPKYLPPHSPPSVLFLCCICVVSLSLFFALAHSDAFNTSRVMQVWLTVCGQTAHSQTVQISCFVVRAR